MVKTEFEFEGNQVIAYAHSVTGLNVRGLVLKFVDDEGERIYPSLTRRERAEVEELAMEYLQNEEFESELDFS